MKQSLKEHMDYIILLREEIFSKIVEYERLLRELGRDNEDWKAQCMARQLYIKHETKQLFKAVAKAHEMWDKAKALRLEFIPIGKNGQQLLNFIEEVKDHYKQMKAFYGYNCNLFGIYLEVETSAVIFMHFTHSSLPSP